MENKLRNKQTAHYFMLGLFLIIFVAFPNIAFAWCPTGWWAGLLGWICGLKESAEILGNILQFFLTFIFLLFSGLLPVIAIAAGVTYVAMFLLSAIASAVFAIMKPLIEATLSVIVVPGPSTVNFVNQGWQISRDIASLFFIVILAFIGLATILGLQSYQVRKTLPALLLMAVLLNFSGLVVGFVVDMSNLLSFGFIDKLQTSGGSFIIKELDDAKTELEGKIKSIQEILRVNPPPTESPIDFFIGLLTSVLTAGAKVIFYFFFCLALLAILFLYIFRIGILWLLTIFAPLAFASYVLPATRQFWRQWWQALFQWALMVVPMSFFLYLATLIMNIKDKAAIPLTGIDTGGQWFGNILISFIQPLFILLVMFVGFMISITFVPAVSRGLVMKGGRYITGAATAGALAGGAALGKRIAPELEKFGERVRGPRKTEEEIAAMTRREKFGWRLRRGVGAVGVPGEMIAKEITGAIKKKEEADVEKMNAEYKGLSAQQKLNRFRLTPERARKAAILRSLSENNPKELEGYLKGKQIKEQDIIDAGKLLWDRGHKEFAARHPTDAMAAVIDPVNWQAGLKNIEIGKALLPPIFNEYKELEDKLKTAVDPAEIAALQARIATLDPQVEATLQAMTPHELAVSKRGTDLIGQGEKKKSEVMQNLTSVIKDPTQVSADALKSSAFMGAVVDTWTGDKIGRMATHFGKVAADALQNEIDKRGTGLLKDNGRLALWLTGPAATNAGLTLPEAFKSFNAQQMKNMLRDVRLDMEKTSEAKIVTLINNFRGRQELLFRDYHRAGTNDEMKKVIEGAVRGLGRTMPGKEAVNSRIGKQEKRISDLQQEEIEVITTRRKAQQVYQAHGSPPAGLAFSRWQTRMTEINNKLKEISNDIKKVELQEISSLKKI